MEAEARPSLIGCHWKLLVGLTGSRTVNMEPKSRSSSSVIRASFCLGSELRKHETPPRADVNDRQWAVQCFSVEEV